MGQTEEISLEIKPTSHTGLLLSTQNAKGDYLVLEMKLGNVSSYLVEDFIYFIIVVSTDQLFNINMFPRWMGILEVFS